MQTVVFGAVLILAVSHFGACSSYDPAAVAREVRNKDSKAKPMPIPAPKPFDLKFTVSQHYKFADWSLGDWVDWAFPARFTLRVMPGTPFEELKQRVADQLGGVPVDRIDINHPPGPISPSLSYINKNGVNVVNDDIAEYGPLIVDLYRYLELIFDCQKSIYPQNGLESRALANQIRSSVLKTMEPKLAGKVKFAQFDFGLYHHQSGSCLQVLLEVDQSITQQAVDAIEQRLKVNNGTTVDGDFQFTRMYWGSLTVDPQPSGRSGTYHPEN